MNRIAILTFALTLAGSAAVAQESGCTRDSPLPCTFRELYTLHRDAGLQDLKADAVAAAIEPEVAAANVATTPTPAFGARLHSSYQDFINLMSFAIDTVEQGDDGASLVVRLNPLRSGRHEVAVSGTIAEPSVDDAVVAAVAETAREAVRSALENQLSDFDDVTLTAAYTGQTKECALRGGERCWGRDPRIYSDALARLLLPAFEAEPQPEFSTVLEYSEFLERHGIETEADVLSLRIADLPESAREDAIALATRHGIAHAKQTLDAKAYYDKLNVPLLAKLVENQPQLTADVTYRDRGTLAGADEWAGSLELYWGRVNLNSTAGGCAASSDCFLERLRNLKAGDLNNGKFVLTVSYRRVEPFTLSALPGDPVDGFTPIDIGRSQRFSARGQYGGDLTAGDPSKRARLDVALEIERTRDNELLTDNRSIVSATLSVPLNDQITLPLTLTYANKSEYLDDPREQFGVHFGLTYRLPWEAKR